MSCHVQVQFEQTAQLMPTEVLIQLPSLHVKSTAPAAPLFIVHPIEGVVTALRSLAAQLTCPVWGLQCTPDSPLTSIQDLATFYVQVTVGRCYLWHGLVLLAAGGHI